jgi:hypothetical protein
MTRQPKTIICQRPNAGAEGLWLAWPSLAAVAAFFLLMALGDENRAQPMGFDPLSPAPSAVIIEFMVFLLAFVV